MEDSQPTNGQEAPVLELPTGLADDPTDVSRLARINDARRSRLELPVIAIGKFL
jgi:hypothetical protein